MEEIQQDSNVLIKRRFEELNELRAKGIEPYAYSFEVDSDSQKIKEAFKDGENLSVKIAGRLVALRRMGKASFAHLQDHKGRIQIYLKKDDIGDAYDAF
ncbi:MAG: OB-fold nucleic acid binding domain-containing protein, partial [Ignavibacteria bacterium]